jgi:8-oxo-dGTP diphosphatase
VSERPWVAEPGVGEHPHGEAQVVVEPLRPYPGAALREDAPLVRAGGGVVWRPGPHGRPELVVVHRPKYDDWSLPKGKCERGETESDCALREVTEETGLRCELGPELAPSAYVDRKGRPKVVRWWAMTVLDGAFTPGDEVDELRWVDAAEARRVLSYDRDLEVLASFLARTT